VASSNVSDLDCARYGVSVLNPVAVEAPIAVKDQKQWKAKEWMYRMLGWESSSKYDLESSQFSQDGFDAKTFSFWFVTICSNSFAVIFGIKAFLFGVHPKFYFSKLMVRSIAFHIIVGSLEFLLMVTMYLVPLYMNRWLSVLLVMLDSVQNLTIWIQMRNSSGSKFVTNACYLYCLWVKVLMDFALLLVDPFSRDLVWGIYFILSAFTFTRIAGIPFKRLALFKGMIYTVAVWTATMITSSMAFGHLGPFSLYLFLICYALYQQCFVQIATKTKPIETAWTAVSQRNPFDFKNFDKFQIELMQKTGIKKEERARIVFDVIAGTENAKILSEEHLAKLLCVSGVTVAEVHKSFLELSNDKDGGINFETFLKELPSVWNWYYDYMKEAVQGKANKTDNLL